MLRYMRSSEPKGNGNNDNDGLEESPNPASQPAAQSTLQSVPSLASRQLLAEAARIPVPFSARGATPTSPRRKQPRIKRPQRQSSFSHAGSDSDINREPPTPSDRTQQQMWEESSINSMFAESVATAARPARANTGKQNNSVPQQQKAAAESVDPLLEADRGILGILPGNAAREVSDNRYMEHSPFGSPRHVPVLKHAKYVLRNPRAAGTASQPPAADRPSTVESPESRVQRGESMPNMGAGMAGQDTTVAHYSFFRDLSTSLGRTPGRPETEDGRSQAPTEDDEATNQQTPRQHRPSPSKPVPQKFPIAVPQKRALLESSVPRMTGAAGGRRDKKMSQKRKNSLDYDDGVLHAMSYSDLRDEPFDHDPTRTTVQQVAAPPPKLSLEERLVDNKDQDVNSQHRFFTEMSMKEWDESGDWFLSQFSDLTNRIREKRQAKRRKVAEFEAEIADRENTVRAKMESIERTLDTLRQEGEGMMRNKAVDI